MRERMRQLGGSLEIRSDGTGTTVKATLPLEYSRPRRVPNPQLAEAATDPQPKTNSFVRSFVACFFRCCLL